MSDIISDEPIIPLVNVVAGFREDVKEQRDWEIVPTPGEFGAGVDFVNGILAVPLDGDRHSQEVQLRKLVELRCSPTDQQIYKQMANEYKSHGVTENVIRAAEFARISAITQKFAEKFGIPSEPDGSEKIRGKNLASAGSTGAWDQAVEFTLKHHGTKAFDAFASGVRSVNPAWSKQLRSLVSVTACMRLLLLVSICPMDIVLLMT
jgi:nitrate reductase beta subunit